VQPSSIELSSDDQALEHIPRSGQAGPPEMAPIIGRVKWFDSTRGFGFLVSDEIAGDVLLHFNVLRKHGRRSVPEGALIEFVPVRLERGLQVSRIMWIDLSAATVPPPPRSSVSPHRRAEREALQEAAGEFEPVEVKWFNRVRGFGFINRTGDDEDIFIHMETVRQAGLSELQPGERLEARFARGPKGLTALELRTW
jgi:CspA family cold shock protein